MSSADDLPNKKRLAIALAYEMGVDPAPKVVASGKDHVADQIIKIAREHGIEIKKDEDLAKILATIDVGSPIPFEAYVAVAEILSYLYRANKRAGSKK